MTQSECFPETTQSSEKERGPSRGRPREAEMKAPMLSRGPPRGGSSFGEREKSGVQTETGEGGGHFSHGPGADPEAQAHNCPLHAWICSHVYPIPPSWVGTGSRGRRGPSSRP